MYALTKSFFAGMSPFLWMIVTIFFLCVIDFSEKRQPESMEPPTVESRSTEDWDNWQRLWITLSLISDQYQQPQRQWCLFPAPETVVLSQIGHSSLQYSLSLLSSHQQCICDSSSSKSNLQSTQQIMQHEQNEHCHKRPLDGHNDLPYFDLKHKLLGHTDIQRLRAEQAGGQFKLLCGMSGCGESWVV
jgi:hypothetical protein